MKPSHFLLFTAALIPALIPLSGCGRSESDQDATQSTKAAAKELVADVKTTASDSWDSIKDYTYEKRADFAAGLERLATKRDAEIQEMNAKVTGLPDTAAKERDRAVKEFNEARSYLKSQLTDLRTGSADTWADAKEKITQAWQKVQAAYDKVKASPTS